MLWNMKCIKKFLKTVNNNKEKYSEDDIIKFINSRNIEDLIYIYILNDDSNDIDF